MSESPFHHRHQIEDVAALWLARRDRGLTAAEQDEYLQWLRKDPRHGTVIARLEKSWRSLDRLSHWRPAHSRTPNPDLLAPARKTSAIWYKIAAVAALVMLTAISWIHFRPQVRHSQAIIHPGPERLVLEDGSIVELNVGARVDVQFTPAERRVRLLHGEALFTVAKNPARPFIVTADKLSVRAVGTAFCVSLDQEAVSVLVTEGKVRLDEAALKEKPGEANPLTRELSHLVAGQKAVINRALSLLPSPSSEPSSLQVTEITPAEIEHALSWQGLRLEFVEMRLGDVVAEFNRYNVQKLVVANEATSAILIGGNFRADNINAFVRLLDAGFGIKAKASGNLIVLEQAH